MSEIVCVGTGHRPDKLGGFVDYDSNGPIRTRLREEARRVLREEKVTHVISGMALGWDTILVEAAVDMQIPFTALIPFRGFSRPWTDAQRKTLQSLVWRAEEVEALSEAASVSRANATKLLMKRNRRLIDELKKAKKNGFLFACWNGDTSGGTWNTVELARTMRLRIVRLDPDPIVLDPYESAGRDR